MTTTPKSPRFLTLEGFGSTESEVFHLEQQSLNVEKTTKRTAIVAFLVVLIGVAAGAGFLWLGIHTANNEVQDTFERRATDTAKEIEAAWADYETSALWMHESCRNWRTDGYDRTDFEVLYHYMTSTGLEFVSAVWAPNITSDERSAIEQQGRKIWGDLPGVNYTGFMGQEPDPENPSDFVYSPRSEQPFYFPIHFGEPKDEVASISHYDLASAPWERPSIEKALDTWKPALTGRFELVSQSEHDGYGVALYHPGAKLPKQFGVKPRDLAAFAINVRALLTRAAPSTSESMAMYLFDSTKRSMEPDDLEAQQEYLAGLELLVPGVDQGGNSTMTVLPEISYEELQKSDLYYEKEFNVGGRTWTTVVVNVEGTYKPDLTFIIFGGVLIIGASVLLAIWMVHNMHQSIRMNRVVMKAAAEAAIVSNLFPAHVRERMIEDAKAKHYRLKAKHKKGYTDVFTDNGEGSMSLSEDRFLTSEGIFGSKPIAELHPYTTILFADLCGFTAWASVREPSQVFTLLEIIFNRFDSIAARRRVYKVETVGDSYVAVAGLPKPRQDHAVIMARFSLDCLGSFQKLVKLLERTLGPDTGELGIRIGLHSGQVVAGVLRGDKGRFQLFGDTVNMASRIESMGIRNQIQISQATADLLVESGREKWIIPRENMIDAKGFGKLPVYFLNINSGSRLSLVELNEFSALQRPTSDKMTRLVEWNVEILSKLLKSISARRQASLTDPKQNICTKPPKVCALSGEGTVLDEAPEIITLPEFKMQEHTKAPADPNSIQLDPTVVSQLSDLVTIFASMYRDNPFHNFEHASHVTMSVVKMMGRIIDPNKVAGTKNLSTTAVNRNSKEMELHDHTFGINSDPLTQFACAFSAIIHDLDHQGVPNMILIQEGSPLAAKYKNKSVAEQNSVDLAWGLLMQPKYEQLRTCICGTEEEFSRFRQLVVLSVMATDIMDKELGAARKARWSKAFSEGNSTTMEDEKTQINRKATIVLEHLIQASDISHTMQHWHIYARWNGRLFKEMYKGYKAGRLENDPSLSWYEGELGFFDFYIIPLAKKLFTCGVFGVSSDEFLNYALINRKEWEKKGQHMVKSYLKDYNDQMKSKGLDDFFNDEELIIPEFRNNVSA